MKKYFIVFFLSLSMISCSSTDNSTKSLEQEIRQQSAIWNSVFATRDASKIVEILSDDVQMASAGGKWQTPAGTEKFIISLFKRRPDITWVNKPTEINVNPVWDVAYELGDWTESWTEPDGKAEIQGKYFFMWRRKDSVWRLQAAIFTPLSCLGDSSYCQKH